MNGIESNAMPDEYLSVEDIMKRWGCGRAKARLIMDEIGTLRIGRTPFVRNRDVEAYLAEHDSIHLDWGKP